MADDDRYQRGAEMIKKVYAGDVVVPPKGAMAFSDLMLESLFAEVWTREELGIRDRRPILLGVIGALGEKDTFAIQAKAALKNRELEPKQMQMYWMSTYDLDAFRRFVFGSTFLERFEVSDEEVEAIREDDEALMRFAFRWLSFALSGKRTMKLRETAVPEQHE